MTTQTIFILTGIALFAMGLFGSFIAQESIRRFLAINVASSGVFMILVTLAYRGLDRAPDALPHALVLTGIVVAVSATALGLALIRALDRSTEQSS